MNAELWVKSNMERTALTDWLIRHNVEFDETAETEELRQLYIKKECGG